MLTVSESGGLSLNLAEGLSRLLHPAMLLVLLGAVLGFGGQRICGRLLHLGETAGLIARLIGVALVMAGLLLLFR